MRRFLLLAFFAARAWAADPEPANPSNAGALTVAQRTRATPVDFEKEILPFLKNSCLACHNTTKAKGGLNLENPKLILQGGDTGPGVSPGKSADSLIFKAASHLDRELIMPPKDNKANAPNLTSNQLALLQLWIEQGAKGEVHATAPVAWLDQPPHLDPMLAVALTSDGQFAAAGRGNRIDVYHVPSQQWKRRLSDPQLEAGFTNAAHRDLVNALAFNADGTLLASAGYREVKLWHRPRNVQLASIETGSDARVLAISPDRRWFVSLLPDQALALCDLRSGNPQRSFSGAPNAPLSVRFSPNGGQVASLSPDPNATLRVWNVADGALLDTRLAPEAATSLAWLTTNQLVIGCNDGGVEILPAESPAGEQAAATVRKSIAGQTNAVVALEPMDNGRQLLSVDAHGLLRRWNVEDGKVMQVFTNDGPVVVLAIRPDGKRLAAAGTNGVARLWSLEDGKRIAEMKGDRYANERVAETERVLTVAKLTSEFHEKARDAAQAEEKKQAARVTKAAETNAANEKLFVEKKKTLEDAEAARLKSDKELAELLAEIQKTTDTFEKADRESKDAATKAKAASVRLAETRLAAERAGLAREDATKIATDSAGVATRAKAAISNDLPPEVKAAAERIAEDAAGVATKTKSLAEAVSVDADMKRKLAAEAQAAADKAIDGVAGLAFAAGQLKPAFDKIVAEAPAKRKQATNSVESTTKGLATASNEMKRAETRKGVTHHELELALKAAERASNAVLVAKAQVDSAVATQRKTDADLETLRKAAAARQSIDAIAFSPDGRTLATAGDDRKVHLWSAENGAPFEVLDGHSNAVRSLAFVENSALLSEAEGRRILWNLDPPWTLVRTLGTGGADSPLADRVNAVDFSPDGRTLATGSGEPTRSGEVMLWDVSDGRLLNSFTNVHSDAVLSLDFSPDAKCIASAAADRFVRVTELATGKVVKAFEGHTSYVLGVAWKRDNRTLASAGADKVIKVWDFVSGERKKNIEGAEKEVTAISFVGATGEAVAASGDSQVRLMRENGDKVRSFEGAADFMNAVAVTPDGVTVVAGGQDGTMHVWNGNTGAKVATFTPGK